jgi:hypothetical protein
MNCFASAAFVVTILAERVTAVRIIMAFTAVKDFLPFCFSFPV